MARVRADVLLVRRGLAESRTKAQAAIEAGGVTADGRAVTRAAETLEETADLTLAPAFAWVSRAGTKLAYALDAFGVDPAGRVCLDIGASTGGFTDVLLKRGASKVFAVDVGVGQLHAKLVGDSRVVSLQSRDARTLTRAEITEPPDFVVCDASFIGLAKVLPVALSLAAARADLVALVKPQFEAGPGAGDKRGVLEEAVARAAAAQAIGEIDGLEGFAVQAFADSPIRGGEGNLELLVHARRG